LSLEDGGHALFDLYPERRGNIFADEVYRFTKARDSVSSYLAPATEDAKKEKKDNNASHPNNNDGIQLLPHNHKFSTNDIILLTLQPDGSGNFYGTTALPNHRDATSVEARVLNTGPTYVDVAMAGGAFEAAFGPAPNNVGPSGKGDARLRLRADRFFSNVPYLRMVSALGQVTALPPRQVSSKDEAKKDKAKLKSSPKVLIQMDPVIRETIISTYGLLDSRQQQNSGRVSSCDVSDLAKRVSKAPFPKSVLLANQVLGFMQSNPGNLFRPFNGPQLKVIAAALTRKVTMIHGPPGTGKTSVAGAIAFGFVHQCRNLETPQQSKVLACAFSNVGADNLAEEIASLGLKVVRVGKASGVSQSLWDMTLDAAIDRDPHAKKALEEAAVATANLGIKRKSNAKGRSSSSKVKTSDGANNHKRETATTAVKAAAEACRIAATRALRQADVIVSTSIGAADARLLAACGIMTEEELEEQAKEKANISVGNGGGGGSRASASVVTRKPLAPDGLPALTLPFTIVDEACQSVEPANLVPLASTDSCRALVLLGDPCQLPPTVKTDTSGVGASPLSRSLMSRLAQALPHPVMMNGQADSTLKDESFLNAKATRQAVSLMNYKNKVKEAGIRNSDEASTTSMSSSLSYRKQFSGSLLLSLQYRMHPSISAFSSAVFYDGLLGTPAFLAEMRSFPDGLSSMFPTADPALGVRFIDVGGRTNEQRGQTNANVRASAIPASDSFPLITEGGGAGGSSYSNEAEALEIMHILKSLFKKSTAASTPQSIGIVTPYAAQVALIKTKLAEDQELAELRRFVPHGHACRTIEVKSVDAYQGRERDIILFSSVRSNRNGRIGFLSDWRRMNVALTRAKSGLIVVGCRETLNTASGDSNSHWEAFIKWCDGVGCVFPSSSLRP
jgi:hypothetical protein